MNFLYTAILTLGLVVLSVQTKADEYPFDRIFTTPQQRLALDEYRRQGHDDQGSVSTDLLVETSKAEDGSEQLRFSGYLLGNDGKYTLWLNGKSGLGDDSNDKAHTHGSLKQGDKDVLFKNQEKQARLRPGQLWELDSGTVKEVYNAQPALKPKALAKDVSVSGPTTE